MKKIMCIFIFMLLTMTATLGIGNNIKKVGTLGDPPKDIDWASNSNRVADWYGMDITADGHTGRVEGIEDTNGEIVLWIKNEVGRKWRDSSIWATKISTGEKFLISKNAQYAPIKRPLSRGNTSPSQMQLLLCRVTLRSSTA